MADSPHPGVTTRGWRGVVPWRTLVLKQRESEDDRIRVSRKAGASPDPCKLDVCGCGCGGRAGQRRVENCGRADAQNMCRDDSLCVFLKDCILLPRCLTTSRACSPKTARARCTPQNSTTTWPSAASSLPPDPTAASVRPGAADTLCMHTNQPPSSSCTQPSTTSPASRRCGSTSTRASRSLHAIPGNETRAL